MESLPFEVVDKIFEFLPLKEIIMYRRLNAKFTEAADRQLRLRCRTFDMVAFTTVAPTTAEFIIRNVGQYVKKLEVRWTMNNLTALAVQNCPNLDYLVFNHLDGICDYDLSNIKAIDMNVQQFYDDNRIKSYFERCSNQLEAVKVLNHGAQSNSKLMRILPTSIRRMQIVAFARRNFSPEIKFLRRNPNIKDFFLAVDSISFLPGILKNLRNVENLGIRFEEPFDGNFQELAKMPKLVKLHINVHGSTFLTYTSAIDETHALSELHISLQDVVINPRFAAGFGNFRHLTKMIVHIKNRVTNSHLLLRPIGTLAREAKLKSLVISGQTFVLDLHNNGHHLEGIEQLHICEKRVCMCGNYLRYKLIRAPFD